MDVVVTALIIVLFSGGSCKDVKGRWKREVEGNLEIETVIILDEEYVANQRKLGHTTNQSLVELMQLKWTGVQAEWGKENVLGYNITISVKEIVIWESNPTWYTPSNKLDNTLLSICRGAKENKLWTNYDHIHLYTGRQGTDVSGKAYTGDICKAGRKCAVSTDTRVDEYYISAHELGHCMGMGHDWDVGCGGKPGIMGGKTAGWSSCSVAALKILVQGSSSVCLQEKDVTKDPLFTLAEMWPGMVYTADEICEFKFGHGFRLKSERTSCSGGSCIYEGTNKTLEGVVFSYSTPTDGSYCGEEKVCSSQIVGSGYECISWNDTGLDTRSLVKSPGVWSEWQQMSECSRTCGTGVRYRQRVCRTVAWCEGDRYYAEACNTQPCADDSEDEASLIKQRAGETCKHWKDNNIYSVIGKDATNYLTTGRKYGNSGDSQCEVTCDTIEGYTAGGERHGIMPDGTPCTLGSLSSYEEMNNLPRKSGRHGRCVQGVCYCFGCDNTSQCASNDGCGKCGGDNSTCRIVGGLYDTVLASGERAEIAVLPKKSYLIQFYFNYGSMKYHFLEITDEDTGAKLHNYRTLDTMDDPAMIAGTYWFKKATKQYLYAYGPTNQTLIIQLYNYGNDINSGVSYAYSVKKGCNMPPAVSNGTIQLTVPGDTGIGATAKVICDAGFRPCRTIIECMPTESWEQAKCFAIGCNMPPAVTNGTIQLTVPGDTGIGATAKMICDVGFRPSRTIIECMPTESWEQAKCFAIVKPEVPKDIKPIDGLVTETSITIQWKPGYNGGTPQSFVARYSKEQTDRWKEVHIPATNDINMSITITGLESGTSYLIEIFAVNEMGTSSSVILTVKTKTPPWDRKGLVIGLSVAAAVVCVVVVAVLILFIIRRRPKSKRKYRAKSNPAKSLQWSKAVYRQQQ